MKKSLILVIFMSLFLISCDSNNEAYIGILEQDIEVCVDGCQTDYDTYVLNMSTYSDYNNAWLEQFNGDLGENHNIIQNGEMINREDIAREDPVSHSYQLLISMPYKRIELAIQGIREIVLHCNVNGSCEAPFDFLYPNPTEMDFGFDDKSGFARTTNLDDGKKEIRYYTFNFDEDDMQYEIFQYSEESGSLLYSYFNNGIFREYHFSSETEFDYYYFNSKTRESFALYKDIDSLELQKFDPDKGVYYQKSQSEKYEVIIYDDFCNMIGLSYNDDVYTFNVSMFYMNGWDALTKDISNSYPDNKVYNGETEVFTNYMIEVRTYDLKYVEVFGQIEMSVNEWNDFEIPTEFTGSAAKSDLTDELTYLMDLESPYNLINVTDEEVFAQYTEIINLLDTKFASQYYISN
ncbi:hypothetical protein ACAG96_07310 [Candidatus Izemoplasma sp. B36]|uniref:hypothetical protein n=1 Tax=Candidatus Izemoplasma sp. B36 TaxID=3242468 RepID=UPI0035577424